MFRLWPFQTDDRMRGFSLVSLLVAIGIVGFLGLVVAQTFKGKITAANAVASKGELEDLRNFVRVSFDCTESAKKMPSGCPSGSEIELRRQSGAIVIAKDGGTVLGKYRLRASCGGGSEIVITYSPQANKSAAARPLFIEVPLVCR